MKKNPVEFPADFLEFWKNADEETRMMAAYVGCLSAMGSVMCDIEETIGSSFD